MEGADGLLCSLGDNVRQEQLHSIEDGSISKLQPCIICEVELHLGQHSMVLAQGMEEIKESIIQVQAQETKR